MIATLRQVWQALQATDAMVAHEAALRRQSACDAECSEVIAGGVSAEFGQRVGLQQRRDKALVGEQARAAQVQML